jgi:4,5-dihydroxyphthalate decarboxylase
MRTFSMILFGGDYEHTLEIPSVRNGVELDYRPVARPELFAKVLRRQKFDACEFSLSNYIMMRDRGDDWLTAIPVFPAREFRHGTILVRRDDLIESFSELSGRRVGIPDYTMTAGVWCRGLLAEYYDLHWSKIAWLSSPTPRISPPKEANVAPLHDDLEEALANGRIDALLLPTSRDAAAPRDARRFRPLLREWRAAEVDYFHRTGIFPISHVVVVAKSAIAANPMLPSVLMDAYSESMARARQRRLATTFLPWGKDNWKEVMDMFGQDPLPYGLETSNRIVINKLQDYLVEQRLIRRRHDVSSLFVDVGPNSAAG